MNSNITKLAVVGALLMSQFAMADFGEKKSEKWRKDHPKQAEVNGRLQNQQNRVQQGQNNGSLTQGQANKINKQDQHIYNQEQRMKARNGSDSLTAGQQAKLNHEENGVSHEIKHDESVNKTSPVVPPSAPSTAAPNN